jgi:hypothetical protein
VPHRGVRFGFRVVEHARQLLILAVVAEVVRMPQAFARLQRELSYWRERSGVEADFVVHGPEGLQAVEVTNACAKRQIMHGSASPGAHRPQLCAT